MERPRPGLPVLAGPVALDKGPALSLVSSSVKGDTQPPPAESPRARGCTEVLGPRGDPAKHFVSPQPDAVLALPSPASELAPHAAHGRTEGPAEARCPQPCAGPQLAPHSLWACVSLWPGRLGLRSWNSCPSLQPGLRQSQERLGQAVLRNLSPPLRTGHRLPRAQPQEGFPSSGSLRGARRPLPPLPLTPPSTGCGAGQAQPCCLPALVGRRLMPGCGNARGAQGLLPPRQLPKLLGCSRPRGSLPPVPGPTVNIELRFVSLKQSTPVLAEAQLQHGGAGSHGAAAAAGGTQGRPPAAPASPASRASLPWPPGTGAALNILLPPPHPAGAEGVLWADWHKRRWWGRLGLPPVTPH